MNELIDKVVIRRAIPSDANEILNLVKELAAYEEAADQVTVTVEEYKKLLKIGQIHCNLAELDGDIVGMALYYPTFSTWRGLMYYLEDFIVTKKYRGKGIGGIIMDSFISDAKAAGAKLVKWQVLDWNQPAIDFYEKMGCTIEKEWWNAKKFI